MSSQAYGVSVADFNVSDRGDADASAGIQKALDSGAPHVYIPYGRYRIDKGLKISGSTRLVVHPQATLFFGDGAGRCASDFLISNRNEDSGDSDISISGGIWDGNNANNPRGSEGDTNAYTGALMNMKNVDGFRLENVVLKDSTAYFTRFTRVRNFRIQGVRFEMTHVTRNQDGIHCCGYCENGHIHDIKAHGRYTTGDDLIALNADDGLLRSELLGAEAGPIRNLHISDIRADDCHSLVRLASVWSEISDIDIRGVYGGCRHYVLNADALRYCRRPLFDSDDPAYAEGVGLLKNVHIQDAEVHSTSDSGLALFCLESRMKNFSMSQVRRSVPSDASPESPLLEMKNVIQDQIVAEYRQTAAELDCGAADLQPVAGRPGVVRTKMTDRKVDHLRIHTDYLHTFAAGMPVLRQLPEKNCMVGLAADS
ncbi:MAG: glycosyl hydrolase family 28-related protein [Phycisphaerae bacterium]